MISKPLASVALLLFGLSIPTPSRADSVPPPVAEFIFSGGAHLSFGPDDVISVQVESTTDNRDEMKVLFIELRSATQVLWQDMNAPNAGSTLSYRLCGKIMGSVYQQAVLSSARMMLPTQDVAWAKSVLLGQRACGEELLAAFSHVSIAQPPL